MADNEKNKTISYRLDSENRITSIEGDWLDFAFQNGGQGLEIPGLLGRHIREFIADEQTLDFFLMIIHNVRLNNEAVTVSYRCDAPDKRRFMEFIARPEPQGGIECVSTIRYVQPRKPQPALAKGGHRSSAYLTVCSWCNKVRIGREKWVEVEQAVDRGEIDRQKLLPRLAHGICSGCMGTMKASLTDVS